MRASNLGFSIVELSVVIAITALLLTFGMPAYSTWRERIAVGAQIDRLYGDLQFARRRAYSEKVSCGISWAPGRSPFSSYQIRSDGDGDGDIDDDAAPTDPVLTSRGNLRYAVRSTNSTVRSVSFDGRGFARNMLTLYVQTSSSAATSCTVVSRTRITVGKWDGNNCIPR